jgi:hypothetical protein
MKNYIKKILKTMFLQFIILIILLWAVTFAVTFPSSTPILETVWWKFIQYFNNMTWDCPNWKSISWFDTNLTKICN